MESWQGAGFRLGCSLIGFLGRFGPLNSSSFGLYWLRRFYSFLCDRFTGPREFVHQVEDVHISGPQATLALRIYRPNQEARLPAIIYLHGGCFCVGDLNSHDALNRALANAASCLVIAVDYRLSPEHQFPAAVEDACHVLSWAKTNANELGIDPEKIAIAGDSAGGAIAATAARWDRDRGGPKPALQLLIYPMTDAKLQTRSARIFANGPILSRDLLAKGWYHYSPDEQLRLSSEVSPLAASDLRDLPQCIIIAADKDPLTDEGQAYAEALRKNGVSVSTRRYPGTVHGFFQLPSSQQGRKAIDDVARLLREHFEQVAVSVTT